ncbi:MAG: FliM/FliN family flagellar motor switch protein [Terracidiphilus sp.]|jgi:flagellar motor switch protein FliM
MSLGNREQLKSDKTEQQRPGGRKPIEKQRAIHVCDFRTAGRLSNENARALLAMNETFARGLASALDAYLGTGLELKVKTLDQLPIKDHLAGIPPLCYIVPFAISSIPCTMILECDIDLAFPFIEFLLGGTEISNPDSRDLSEIEEEIMQDVTALFARQAEIAWRMPPMSMEPTRRIKASQLNHYCPPNEKVTSVRFEVEITGITGSFQLVFPSALVNALIKQLKLEEPQRKGGLRYFPAPNIRERMLDCDVVLEAGVPRVKVAVRDLIALQPGSVLKLRAPVRNPGMLTVEGMEMFEAAPVRNGSQKAAQLGRRVQPANWGREQNS